MGDGMAKGMQAMEQDGAMDGAPMAPQAAACQDRAARMAGDRRRGAAADERKWKTSEPAKAPVRPPPAHRAGPDLEQRLRPPESQETAFFFPHLISDAEGQREAGIHDARGAHASGSSSASPTTPQLRSGYLEDKVVTAKDLMVQPNPPRFVREGDVIEFTVKVSNQSPTHANRHGPADLRRRPHDEVGRRGARQLPSTISRSTLPPRNRRRSRGSWTCPTAWGR